MSLKIELNFAACSGAWAKTENGQNDENADYKLLPYTTWLKHTEPRLFLSNLGQRRSNTAWRMRFMATWVGLPDLDEGSFEEEQYICLVKDWVELKNLLVGLLIDVAIFDGQFASLLKL